MNRFAAILLLTASGCAEVANLADPTGSKRVGSLDGLEAEIRAINSRRTRYGGSDVCMAYRALFAAATPEQLALLKTHSDDSIALQAAWEELGPPYWPLITETGYEPDRNRIAEFVVLLEKLSGSKAPGWWIQELHARCGIEPRYRFGRQASDSPYTRTGLQDVHALAGLTVRQEGKGVVIGSGRDSIVIPLKMIRQESPGHISATFTDTEVFVANHDDLGSHCEVACIDRATGATRWKTEPNCSWGAVVCGIVLVPGNWCEIVVGADRVTLFAGGLGGERAQGFSRKDGTRLFRFNTQFSLKATASIPLESGTASGVVRDPIPK